MVHKLYLLLRLFEVGCDGWFNTLGIHIFLKLLSTLEVGIQVLQSLAADVCILRSLEVAYALVGEIPHLPGVMEVKVELVWMETKSLHFYLILLTFYKLLNI